jgi:alginate O-acetyltransferase complex protein AlgI
MLFNSLEFLFLYLPTVLLVFNLLQRRGNGRLATGWLTLSSLFFYGWWNPVYVPLILLSMAFNFTLGRKLARGENPHNRMLLTLGVVFNLGLLAYFKYFNFFIDNINLLVDTGYHVEKIVLPLAISFYTFQQITYLVDSYKGLTEPHSLLEFSLFVTFFPQLIAGPIVHHSEMLNQFRELEGKPLQQRNLVLGLSILSIGLFKKVVIADGFSHFASPMFAMGALADSLNTIDVLIGLFAYTFQLYFDFSGYSDMAIGLAFLFGIKLPVNFFSPYRARNIGEFWRMWHATLARFLREYVFTPLGGFVRNRTRQRLNLLITMFLSGVWHGAGWTFMVFGLVHGIMVVAQRIWRTQVTGPYKLTNRPLYQMAMQVITFLAFALSLLLFRADNLQVTANLLTQIFSFEGSAISAAYLQAVQSSTLVALMSSTGLADWTTLFTTTLLLLALLACWCLPNTLQIFAAENVMLTKLRAGRAPVIALHWQASTRWAIYIGSLLAVSAMNLTEVSEFIYFQF